MTRIKHLGIRNFQSLAEVNLELGPLTVIVGPSSSGKSAIGRALRLLTSNKAGTDYITRGTEQCLVQVSTDDGNRATIARGKQNSYMVGDEVHTKLGTGVPVAAQAVIGIAPGDQPNFAGQFDPPFLLAESGTTGTATVFGKLTNVDILFSAAREANRRRLSDTAQMKTYTKLVSDTEQVISELPDVVELRDRVERTALHLTTASDALQQHHLLSSSLNTITTAADAYRRLPPQRVLPDVAAIVELSNRRSALELALRTVASAELQSSLAADRRAEWELAVQTAAAAYKDELIELGECPTCGQPITEENLHAIPV